MEKRRSIQKKRENFASINENFDDQGNRKKSPDSLHPRASIVSLGLTQGQRSLPVIEEKSSARRKKRHSMAEPEKSMAER
jgi:hypothetical protein